MKFKIGDKVKIRRDSLFFNEQGHHEIGEIWRITQDNTWFSVKFKDNYKNGYNAKDLDIVSMSWKERFK